MLDLLSRSVLERIDGDVPYVPKCVETATEVNYGEGQGREKGTPWCYILPPSVPVCDVESPYKAIFLALGNGNIPKVIHASLYAGLQVLDLFALIKQDIKNISNHIY